MAHKPQYQGQEYLNLLRLSLLGAPDSSVSADEASKAIKVQQDSAKAIKSLDSQGGIMNAARVKTEREKYGVQEANIGGRRKKGRRTKKHKRKHRKSRRVHKKSRKKRRTKQSR